MRLRHLLVVFAFLPLAAFGRPDEKAVPQPVDSKLVEEVQRKLLQLDVSVDGPPELIGSLSDDDFILSIAGRPIHRFEVDSMCAQPPTSATASSDAATDSAAEQAPPLPSASATALRPTYIFYFDQSLLTMHGRQRSLHLAQDLLDSLLVPGAGVSIASSGKRLKFYARDTDDPDTLRQALITMMDDHQNWDPYLVGQSAGAGDVSQTTGTMRPEAACWAAYVNARYLAWEEAEVVERSSFRLSAAIEALATTDPPKAVFYFADGLRKRAGRHFVQPLADKCGIPLSQVWSEFALEQLTATAATYSTRLYTFLPDGLRRDGLPLLDPANKRAEAEDTITSLALETGGRAFIQGYSNAYAVEQVKQHLSCFYLFSLDARGLPVDRPLGVTLNTTIPGVKATTRGLVVIQSESQRRRSEITAQFLNPPSAEDSPLDISVVPIETGRKSFQHLIQLRSLSRQRARAWDFGVTVIHQEKVVHEVSGRIEGAPSDEPMVIESMLPMETGEYEIIAVLAEVDGPQRLGARHRETVEVDPRDALMVPKIVAQQRVRGTFWRDGELRAGGSLFYDRWVELQSRAPVTLTALVCRPAKQESGPVLRAERTLRGFSMSKPARSIDVDLRRNTCVAFRDMVPSSWLSEGTFELELALFSEDNEPVAAARRTFLIEDQRRSGTP
ncbi:hypothetical protein ABI59_06935 [Acidobacteria bacterium Mor1]|nr:hypothetical protein ABI59_06935 [Acidobacteria bacterium Mor1]